MQWGFGIFVGPLAMFGINSSVAFYGKMLEDYDHFVEQSGSPRHAINCMLSAYHMAEWIWGDWLQTDYATWKALGIRDRVVPCVGRQVPNLVQDHASGRQRQQALRQ